MIPVWIALLFFLLGGMLMLNNIPEKQADFELARLDVLATDFISYRNAVLKYLEQNPTAAGVISDTSLASCAPVPCLPLGYTITAGRWSNEIVSGVPVVFSVSADNANILQVLYAKSDKSLVIGSKNQNTGRLMSTNSFDTGITIPTTTSTIPNNAVVIIGK